jgi:thiamine-phosphate pyrophosphorylase
MDFLLPPVYPITDKFLSGKETHLAIVRELVRGGATLVQIRDKITPPAELLPDLRRCVEFASAKGITLLVNDRCDLVLASGAAGVHLGQEDLPPKAARRILPAGAVVGFSTHSADQIRTASRLPVDYVGFGPVFPTRSKQNADAVVGLVGLRTACRRSKKPVVAIGGIGLAELPRVLQAGASSAAVISALMKSPRLAAAMERWVRTAESAVLRPAHL